MARYFELQFSKIAAERAGVHPRENSKQQDGKRFPRHFPHILLSFGMLAPLFGCLMSSSNHVARHTKHIVICEILRIRSIRWRVRNMTKKSIGNNVNNIYSITALWNFRRALADNYENLYTFYRQKIGWVDWMRSVAGRLWLPRHRDSIIASRKSSSAAQSVLRLCRYQSRLLLMTYTTDCT